MRKTPETVKHKEYYQLKIKPSQEELTKYYSQLYFQQTKGSYEHKYSAKELKYIENNLCVLNYCYEKIFNGSVAGKTFLDLGAGEGWALKFFKKQGCVVSGVDYSSYAIGKFNKPLKKYFTVEDITTFLDKAGKHKHKFDIVNLTNVIEHVPEPEKLLGSIKAILKPKGIISVTFPNDGSPLHDLLLKSEKINKKFWVASPDHISYFNKNSFGKMARRLGFSPVLFSGDFPIDTFLLNKYSNYVKDASKGKEAHFSRVDFINLVCKLNIQSAAELLINLGESGLGRNITAFLRVK